MKIIFDICHLLPRFFNSELNYQTQLIYSYLSMSNFLTHIELQGFKSFAPKIRFDLQERVVGIVGPNGSGKSNIIDAMRWVLGEREAKQLRGDLLGNLIFAGTSKRPQASLARVTLGFNNADRTLPIDAEEVILTRRIDRAGTSQFFLNDEEVRLKDLIPILARARLGSRGLTIIGQGQSDVFVRINPEERRLMIEEILGLKEFRLKKKTAERRLGKSRVNADTLRVKIEEIKPHLRFLKRQKSKWDRRAEIESELKKIADNYFFHFYHDFTRGLKETEEKIKEFERDNKDRLAKISHLEKEVEQISRKEEGPGKEIQMIRDKVSVLHEKRLDLEKELARLEAQIEYSRSITGGKEHWTSSHLLHFIRSFVDEISQALNRDDEEVKSVLGKWINKFNGLFEEKKSQLTPGLDRANEIKLKLKKISEEEVLLREKEDRFLMGQDKKNQEFRTQIQRLESKKNDLRDLEKNIQEQILTKERLQFRFKELENKWQSLGYPLSELSHIREMGTKENNWDKEERRMDRLRSELIAIGEIDEGLIKEAMESEGRYDFLIKELGDLGEAATHLEKLIKDLDEKIHNDFKKSFGLVNKEFNNYFRLMFGGGKARLKLSRQRVAAKEEEEEVEMEKEDAENEELRAGVEIDLNLPRKKNTGLNMLSGGEKSLVSMAALFALIAVSPPPFLVLDEIDAALDEVNSKKFADLIKEFSQKTQFIIVTHNRVTMEVLGVLYGITMGDDGASRVLSMKLEEAGKT